MPKQTRHAVKSKLQTCIKNVEDAQNSLTIISQDYKEIHPKYFDAFCVAIALLEQGRSTIESLHDNI